jgi:uncharacterized protein (DUF1330 family)
MSEPPAPSHTADQSGPLTLVAMLWPNPGHEQALIEYEDAVLALIPAHGGRVVSRVRRVDYKNPGDSEGPIEVQTIEFPSEQAIADYMVDPVRVGLADVHAAAIARTEVVRVAPVL